MSTDRSARWFAALGPLGILASWWSVASLGLASPVLLPPPADVASELARVVHSGQLAENLAYSLGRMLIGFAGAVLVGVLAGVIVGSSRLAFHAIAPLIDFFRSTPVTTLYPLFVLVLGVSHVSKVGMVFTACVFVVALNTAYGVRHSNAVRREMAQLYGATRFQTLAWITFYESLPQTMIGVRTSISLAWIVEILAEMFMGAQYGVGQQLIEAFTTYAIAEMYAVILVNGLVGFALNRGVDVVEARYARWISEAQR